MPHPGHGWALPLNCSGTHLRNTSIDFAYLYALEHNYPTNVQAGHYSREHDVPIKGTSALQPLADAVHGAVPACMALRGSGGHDVGICGP